MLRRSDRGLGAGPWAAGDAAALAGPVPAGSPMNAKLDHCVIAVSDWEASNAFYRDVLGAEIVPRDALAHLERHDVAVELGPVERHGARGTGTSVYFRDPDGSLMEFISY